MSEWSETRHDSQVHISSKYLSKSFINPLRACAARVTAVVLYVCLSAHTILAVHVIKSIIKDTIALCIIFAAMLK